MEVSAKEFEKVYRQAGENTLVNLAIENHPPKRVLIHDVAKHFMKNEPIHVDFYEVDLTRKIHAEIPVRVVGVAAAVKELGGVLVKNLSTIEVEALPTNLPHEIEVDISRLKTFDDMIRLEDLRLGKEVKILGNPEELIIAVQPPRSEEELAELEKPTTDEAEEAAIKAVAAEEGEEGEGAESAEEKTGEAAEKEAAE